MEETLNLKIVLLGESYVGKTAIAKRYVEDSFDTSQEFQSTVGASFLSKTVTVENIQCDLAIWDTAGQEVYRTLTPMYYRDANLGIIVFDITNMGTYEKVEEWVSEVKNKSDGVVLILCGNKSDLQDQRQVNTNDAFILAKKLDIPYCETSARTGFGVNELFETVIQEYLRKKPVQNEDFQQETIQTVDLNKPSEPSPTSNGKDKCGC